MINVRKIQVLVTCRQTNFKDASKTVSPIKIHNYINSNICDIYAKGNDNEFYHPLAGIYNRTSILRLSVYVSKQISKYASFPKYQRCVNNNWAEKINVMHIVNENRMRRTLLDILKALQHNNVRYKK